MAPAGAIFFSKDFKMFSGPTQGYRTLIMVGCAFLFGFPFLFGYGVFPLTNLGSEIIAALGLALLLFIGAPVIQGRPSNMPIKLTLAWTLFILLLILWKAFNLRESIYLSTPLVVGAYVSGFCASVLAGYTLGRGVSSGDLDFLVARILVGFGVVAALASLFQYLSIDGSLFFLSPLVDDGRTYGFLRQPNHQSTFLNMAIAALIYLRTQANLRHLTWYSILPILIFAVLSTGSRTGLVQIGFLCLLYLFYSFRSVVRLRLSIEVFAIAMLMWMVLFFLSSYFGLGFYSIEKLAQTQSEGLGMREFIWVSTFRMILEEPWLGHALLGYGTSYLMNGYVLDTKVIMSNSHNLLLQMAFDFGIPAALVSVGLMCSALYSLVSNVGRIVVARLVLSLLGCLLLHSMLEFPLWYAYFLFPAGFLLGLYFGHLPFLCDLQSNSAHGRNSVAKKLAALMAGLCVILVAVTMNRDFYRLTPLFVPAQRAEMPDRLHVASKVFWFRQYYELPVYGLNAEIIGNEKERLRALARIGCVVSDVWHQPAAIEDLIRAKYLDDAKWLLYLAIAANPDNRKKYIDYFRSRTVDGVDVINDYVGSPRKVQKSMVFYQENCL
jgi:O-antigen ligase